MLPAPASSSATPPIAATASQSQLSTLQSDAIRAAQAAQAMQLARQTQQTFSGKTVHVLSGFQNMNAEDPLWPLAAAMLSSNAVDFTACKCRGGSQNHFRNLYAFSVRIRSDADRALYAQRARPAFPAAGSTWGRCTTTSRTRICAPSSSPSAPSRPCPPPRQHASRL
jgi:hypothetical protein